MSALAAFHAGPRAILVKLNLECWFLWREKNHRTQRKTLGAGQEPTTNSKHVCHQAGI